MALPGRSLSVYLAAALALLAIPLRLSAHPLGEGTGELGNGFIDHLTTTSHLLLLAALSLLGGQRSAADLMIDMAAFTVSAIAGLVAAAVWQIDSIPELVLISLALATGVLVATQLRLAPAASGTVFALGGLALGLNSGVETSSLRTLVEAQLGTLTAYVVVVFVIASYIGHGQEKEWVKIGARIVGSWITAIAMLMVAFLLK
jgi:urease accessory protein